MADSPSTVTPSAPTPASSAPAGGVDQRSMEAKPSIFNDAAGLDPVMGASFGADANKTYEFGAPPAPDASAKAPPAAPGAPQTGPDGKPVQAPPAAPARDPALDQFYAKEGDREVFNPATFQDFAKLAFPDEAPAAAPGAHTLPANPAPVVDPLAQYPEHQRPYYERKFYAESVEKPLHGQIESTIDLAVRLAAQGQTIEQIKAAAKAHASESVINPHLEEWWMKKQADRDLQRDKSAQDEKRLQDLRVKADNNMSKLSTAIFAKHGGPQMRDKIMFDPKGGGLLLQHLFEIAHPADPNQTAEQRNKQLAAWFTEYASDYNRLNKFTRIAHSMQVAQLSNGYQERIATQARTQKEKETRILQEANIGGTGRQAAPQSREAEPLFDSYFKTGRSKVVI